ncbi:MAG: glycoside hydrolase family 2 protein, partial [Alloprevotella sp.]
MKPLSRITLGVATAWLSLTAPLCAQRQSLNADWLFQRVAGRSAATWQAGQQGTDWNSQFNVQHSEAGSGHSSLAVPDSLLQAEQFQLRAAAAWQAVELPHTAYVEPYVIQSPWQGVCYYKRSLHITPEQAEGLLWIEFEGAMQLADIWVNGKHAAQHAGGFTTFVVDATGLLRAGQNELVVRLDNRDNGLIPPGKPLGTLDFCYHSGLYRDVNLICKPKLHITHPLLAGKVAGGGIFVTCPQVNAQQAVVQVQTEVANRNRQAESLTVRQTLYEWKRGKGCGRKVAQAELPLELSAQADLTLRQQLSVKQPRLWSPDAPNLYVLRTELVQGKEVIDTEDTRIGLRHLEITREGCFINGKRYELDGTNRHQEYPYVGNALSDRAQYRDVWQMRNSGFNTVRLGHYPQDPAVLDACDELGLLAIEPIPGWQYFSKDPLFQSLTYYNVQEMMRRDRNHPCIIMWETTLNESWPPTEWKDGAVRTAHAEMPEGPCYTSGDSYGYSGFDVCYNDWRGEDFSRPNNSTKPAFIREYYDYEFGGHYSTSRVTRGDGERALRQNLWNAQWSHNSNRTRSTHTLGGAVWSMYDYNRGCCDNICYSGVADLYRLP